MRSLNIFILSLQGGYFPVVRFLTGEGYPLEAEISNGVGFQRVKCAFWVKKCAFWVRNIHSGITKC